MHTVLSRVNAPRNEFVIFVFRVRGGVYVLCVNQPAHSPNILTTGGVWAANSVSRLVSHLKTDVSKLTWRSATHKNPKPLRPCPV